MMATLSGCSSAWRSTQLSETVNIQCASHMYKQNSYSAPYFCYCYQYLNCYLSPLTSSPLCMDSQEGRYGRTCITTFNVRGTYMYSPNHEKGEHYIESQPEIFMVPLLNHVNLPLLMSQSMTWSNSLIQRSLLLARSPQNCSGCFRLSSYRAA